MQLSQEEYRQTREHWRQVLAEVEETIAEGMGVAQQREEMLEDWILQQNQGQDQQRWLQGLDDFQERMQNLQQLAHKAEHAVVEVDNALKEGEDALRDWLQKSESTRSSLATWLERWETRGEETNSYQLE